MPGHGNSVVHRGNVNNQGFGVCFCYKKLNIVINDSGSVILGLDLLIFGSNCTMLSFGPARGIINTEQTSGPLGLRYSPPRPVVKSLGLPPSTFSLQAEGVNNYGLVTPWSVLSIYVSFTI